MPVVPLSFIRPSRIGRIAFVPALAAVFFLVPSAAGQSTPASSATPAVIASNGAGHAVSEGQPTQAKPESTSQQTAPAQAPSTNAAPAGQESANQAGQVPCPPGPDMDIPVTSTIQAKVTGMLDSGHLKPGKVIWVTVMNGLVYPDCTLNAGAAIYAHITAADSRKDPPSSELSLKFDRADCEGRGKKEMPLWVVGLMGPPDTGAKARDAVPVGLHGGGRNITEAAKATNFVDDALNPGGAPNTVQPGIVIGLSKVRLDLQGGPGCSTRIFSSDSSIQLAPGSEFILVVQSKPQ